MSLIFGLDDFHHHKRTTDFQETFILMHSNIGRFFFGSSEKKTHLSYLNRLIGIYGGVKNTRYAR